MLTQHRLRPRLCCEIYCNCIWCRRFMNCHSAHFGVRSVLEKKQQQQPQEQLFPAGKESSAWQF